MTQHKWFNTEYEGYHFDGTYTGGADEVCIEEVFINCSNANAVDFLSDSTLQYLAAQIEYGNVLTYRSEVRTRFTAGLLEAA